jgi:hypothetical protein
MFDIKTPLVARRTTEYILIDIPFKGAVSKDLRPSVFFIKTSFLGP